MNFKACLFKMKMISHHNKRTGKKFFFSIIILAVILIATTLFGFSGIFSSSTISIASPLFTARNSFSHWYESRSYILKNKEDLLDENLKLREELVESRLELLSLDILKEENNELKGLLGRKTEERKSIVASVLLHPPQVPYDVIVIDIGEEGGVKEGMLVGAYGDILLGFVEEVFANKSRVRLYSRAGEEISVLINNTNIFTIAKGNGGGNFEITLPRVDEAKEGSLVITPGAEPFILGIVEFIKADMADAFQKVLFKTPLNIQELKWVEVFPDLTNSSFPQVLDAELDKNN